MRAAAVAIGNMTHCACEACGRTGTGSGCFGIVPDGPEINLGSDKFCEKLRPAAGPRGGPGDEPQISHSVKQWASPESLPRGG